MKQNLIIFTFTAMLLALGGARETFAQKSLETVVNNYIARDAKSQKADEYAEARKIVTGDLDSDGDQDAAVQYTLEGFGGGNSFAQTLVAFRNDKGVYKFVGSKTVGGKFFNYTSTLSSIEKAKIILAIETCSEPPQGICQNPKKGVVSFVLRRGRLVKS